MSEFLWALDFTIEHPLFERADVVSKVFACFGDVTLLMFTERPALREKDIPSLGIKVKMVFTHLYSNSLIIHIGCIKQDMSKAFSANAHVSWVNPLVSSHTYIL